MAAEAAMSFSTSRRSMPSEFLPLLAGNSFFRKLRYSCVSDNSSRLFQKCLPPSRSSFARAAARSIEFFGLESSFIVSLSSVTRRAVLQTLNLVILHELAAHRELVRI